MTGAAELAVTGNGAAGLSHSLGLTLQTNICDLGPCRGSRAVGSSERDGNTRPPDLPVEKPVCRSGSSS